MCVPMGAERSHTTRSEQFYSLERDTTEQTLDTNNTTDPSMCHECKEVRMLRG